MCSCVLSLFLSSLQSVWPRAIVPTLRHVSPLENACKMLSQLSKAIAHPPPKPPQSVLGRGAVGGSPILQMGKLIGKWVWGGAE